MALFLKSKNWTNFLEHWLIYLENVQNVQLPTKMSIYSTTAIVAAHNVLYIYKQGLYYDHCKTVTLAVVLQIDIWVGRVHVWQLKIYLSFSFLLYFFLLQYRSYSSSLSFCLMYTWLGEKRGIIISIKVAHYRVGMYVGLMQPAIEL